MPFNNGGAGVSPQVQGDFVVDALEAMEEYHLDKDERARCFIYLSGPCDSLLSGFDRMPPWLDSIEILIEPKFSQKNADSLALDKARLEPKDVICFRIVPYGALDEMDLKKLRKEEMEKWGYAYVIELQTRVGVDACEPSDV